MRIDTQTLKSWANSSESYADYCHLRNTSLAQVREQVASSNNPHKRISRDKSITSAERQVLWEPLIRKRSLRGLGRFRFGYSFTTNGFAVSILCDNPPCDPKPQKKRSKRSQRIDQIELPVACVTEGRKLVGIDPGKHSILYMTTDTSSPQISPQKFERLEYTSRRRRHDMKVSTFNKLLRDAKTDDVKTLETRISMFNSKSLRLENFSNYLLSRFSGQTRLYDFYQDIVFQKRKFKSYQGRQKSEQQLIKNIEQKFGPRDQIALAIGNWSRKSQMRGCAPSPVVGITILLRKHFQVQIVDEYKTTKTCSKCGGEMKADPTRARTYFDTQKGVSRLRENRSLRRCQNESCGALFSRDYNAAINILAQATHLRDHGLPHPWFTRQRNDFLPNDGHPGPQPGA